MTEGQKLFKAFWENEFTLKLVGETWEGAWNGTNERYNLSVSARKAWELKAELGKL